MRQDVRRGFALALLASYSIATSGCTDWFRLPGGPVPATLPDQAQIWVADSAFLVRDAVLRNDSLLGTVRHAKGDTTGVLVGWGAEEVDSVRVRHVSATRTFLAVVGSAAGILLVFGLALQASDSEL